jgi:DNA polymerase elongation subunit (family B)
MRLRLLDFHIYDSKQVLAEDEEEDDEEELKKSNESTCIIQMFGITADRKTVSIYVTDFNPHFYVKLDQPGNPEYVSFVLNTIYKSMKSKGYQKELHLVVENCKLVKKKKLYGFDNNTFHDFLYLEFTTLSGFNAAKSLWYDSSTGGSSTQPRLKTFCNTEIYESNIPPLLRFFHIYDISPSSWIEIGSGDLKELSHNKTQCDLEFVLRGASCIRSLKECNDLASFKICSFDIEASSSHGDFPVPVKTYKKLGGNIIEYFEKTPKANPQKILPLILKKALTGSSTSSFENSSLIEKVFVKDSSSILKHVDKMIQRVLNEEYKDLTSHVLSESRQLYEYFSKTSNKYNEYSEGNDIVSGDHDRMLTTKSNPKSAPIHATFSSLLSSTTITRESKVEIVTSVLDKHLPPLQGDQVTFIGSTFLRFGEKEPYLNNCIVLNTCTDPGTPNLELQMCRTERDVLLSWTSLIQRENPDIIIGYNIFGFDYKFLFYRAKELNCLESFLRLSRNVDEICCQKRNFGGGGSGEIEYKLDETVSILPSGEHELHYIKMTGRVQIDLYNYFRKEESLPSYKLDYVAGYFIGGWVERVDSGMFITHDVVYCSSTEGLTVGGFVHFEVIGHTKEYLNQGRKYKIEFIHEQEKFFTTDVKINNLPSTYKMRWCLAKDDVSPQDIFRMTSESDDSRYVIAKYCLQDCNLLHFLLNKVDVLTGFIEMASICSVPISFLVFRGQGIKLTSFVAKKCREMDTLMMVLDRVENDEGYEGATVLDPKCDLYLDIPVACVDYASLYPSSMISENLSHDSKVWTCEYDLDGNVIRETGNRKFDHLPEYRYVDITYDTYKYIRKTKTSHAEKVKSGYKVCRFAQYPNGKRAIMPMILAELLKARKDTRSLIKTEKDEFMRNVLDKRQLGYKVTANSLYGQCGAKTSTFFDKDIAASTTATGRSLLIYAKQMIETIYRGRVCDTTFEKVVTHAEYIYGDTDSVFFTFNLKTLTGEDIRGPKALAITIELAQEAGHLASQFLKHPHDLEYEKTFMPFCLLSKKRYVGILYETDVTKGKRKEMGIVLKRRDNAPIVKDVYGGIIDILMKEQNIQRAVDYLKEHLQNLVDEKCPMEKLIITKSLRTGYKNPQQIAHKVLADRIAERDPGNKPSSGDRIPFVFIAVKDGKKGLQGDRIETPTFIRENGLKIDYSFYITNQIMNPVQQLFALVLEKIWISSNKHAKLKKFELEVSKLPKDEKFTEKRDQMRNKEIKELLFDPFLRITENKKVAQSCITHFFKK